ncbi:type II toxin-antitoxin system HicA family toxin [Pokkaliibacter sp. MBI-7]|uniref:type II toxin-antitoxin system HicA family toxin n=1 Tax=Pokkaliibacter sp. MBI-7 TaxID=3040600 RepID=UPI00244856FC|nr:type II toxin-antitoxin system HicA family toxin [Pokkaliibacter sp. MBI-7]MDH2435635.1 type II toxin-antitoxin system HicA family toxin [Pokkaliibacter sp. MBI-7]
MSSRELIKLLEANGWVIVRVAGSHHQLKHSVNGKLLTVPHPRKDLGKGLVDKILKDAGLK